MKEKIMNKINQYLEEEQKRIECSKLDGIIIEKLLEMKENDCFKNLEENEINISEFWRKKIKNIDKFKEKSISILEEIKFLIKNYDFNKINNLREKVIKTDKVTLRMVLYFLFKELNITIDTFYKISNENSKYLILDYLSFIGEENIIFLNKRIKILEENIKELKISLEMILLEKEELEKEVKLTKEKWKKESESNFFIKLNSKENNYFMDNFKLSQVKIKKLMDENYIIPEELESIIITLKSFSKFLRMNKIQEIIEVEKILKINLEESHNYIYYGSEFLDENSEKRVIVESPGWKYEDKIISKPSVREVEKNGR